jgi:hypothetical protein
MGISSFLVIIIFFCLLFMEIDPEMCAAYKKLKIDLLGLYSSLEDLQDELSETEVIDGKIGNIMAEVNSAIVELRQKADKQVRKDIDIQELVDKVQDSISDFSQSAVHSSEELNGLSDKIKNVWKNEIKKTFDEAMKSETR